MSSLSIRHMNYTLQQREHERARRDAAWYASLPAEEKAEPVHYWHVERKAKRGKRWIHHTEFFGTKPQVADYWCKFFQSRKKQFRLVHVMKYGD